MMVTKLVAMVTTGVFQKDSFHQTNRRKKLENVTEFHANRPVTLGDIKQNIDPDRVKICEENTIFWSWIKITTTFLINAIH